MGLLVPEVSAKGLTLLKEAVPALTQVAVLWNAANPANAPVWRDVDDAAHATGLVLYSQQVREPQDFGAAFLAIAQERPEGLLVMVDALVVQHRSQVVEFTIHERLPPVSQFREFASLGGLMSYGPNSLEVYRIAANLKGAKPADLPFEQPTTFELVINLKTGKALGLTVPPLLLALADEVIE